jgi:hypothetical protein
MPPCVDTVRSEKFPVNSPFYPLHSLVNQNLFYIFPVHVSRFPIGCMCCSVRSQIMGGIATGGPGGHLVFHLPLSSCNMRNPHVTMRMAALLATPIPSRAMLTTIGGQTEACGIWQEPTGERPVST